MRRPEREGWRAWLRNRFGFAPETAPPALSSPKKKRYRGRSNDALELEDDFWFGNDHRTWHGRPRWESLFLDDWKWTVHVCKKGEIGASPRQKSVWQTEKTSDGKEHFYLTCPECAAVNDFTNHKIEKDGVVYPCVVCAKCRRHLWIELEGWAGGTRKEHKTSEDFVWDRYDEWSKKYPAGGKKADRDLYGSWM